MVFSFGNTPAPAPGAPAAAPGNTAPAFSSGGANPAPAATAPAGFSFGPTPASTAPAASTPAAAAPGTAPAAAAPGGGVSFGAAPATATTTAPAAGAPATGAFIFGAPTPAPAAGAPAPGGSGFGAAKPATPAPAFGGFSFGASSASGPATTSTAAPTSSTPAPATAAFSLGGSSAPPSTAAATSTLAPATTTPGALGATPAAQNLLQVPEYSSVFPYLKVTNTIDEVVSKISSGHDYTHMAGQELIHLLQCNTAIPEAVGTVLANPKVLEWKAANASVRESLRRNPVVSLRNREAPMTESMYNDIMSLADDLRISEEHALALYAETGASMSTVQEQVGESFVEKNLSDDPVFAPVDLTNVGKAARELFFLERQALLKTLLGLIQQRIRALHEKQFHPVLVATDVLLQNNLVINLVKLVRDWSSMSIQLEKELEQSKPPDGMTFAPLLPTATPPKSQFAKVLLLLAQQERQMAAECLFYLAYHTQLKPDEVAALIDIVKDLSNGLDGDDGLSVLDPFHDVPSPFLNPPVEAQAFAPFASALPPVKDKDPLKWQQELVASTWKRGKPQLLQCVSTLVLSVVCALNGQNELVDRDTHRFNSFGVGNDLLPPVDVTTDKLTSIHERLSPNGSNSWKRKDIWGLLAASYALLLQSVRSILASPRVAPVSPALSIDVRSAWRACLDAPSQCKSFTFARLSLIPAVQRKPAEGDCDSSEFSMSVMAEFMSNYLDVLCSSGEVPISRARWKREEESLLELARSQQQQHREFQAWSGNMMAQTDAVPSEVDLMKRPDCMDDVIGLAVAICSVGPDYATLFWDRQQCEVGEGEDARAVIKLVPSGALNKLESLQRQDRDLQPSYLSFLAALAAAESPDVFENGAVLVDKILSIAQEPGSTQRGCTWKDIMENLRYYARSLSPDGYGNISTTSTRSTSSTPMGESTAYYYNAESASVSQGYQTSSSQDPGRSSKGSKAKELGETNTTILLSHLALITSVASKSPAARCSILSISLPITSSDGATRVGEDAVLPVMFSLVGASLSPPVRGATFATIASLLSTSFATAEEAKTLRDLSLQGWNYLDSCQILPVIMLDQYAAPVGRGDQSSPGLRFPPSSTALVEIGANNAWMPADPRYGIVYEMEYVESRMGWYPSTEGFLKLLFSLISSVGCPADVGKGSRARTGCTPYIEYVAHFVLARATSALAGRESLPFRLKGDRCRLVSHALAVIEAVLTRYWVPSPKSPQSISTTTPHSKKGNNTSSPRSVLESLALPPQDSLDGLDKTQQNIFALDMKNSFVVNTMKSESQLGNLDTMGLINDAQPASSPVKGTALPGIPLPKSPGFAILSDILSADNGDLLNSISRILVCDLAHRGVHLFHGSEADRAALAYAMFGDTPPSVSTAKAGAKGNRPSITRQSLLRPVPSVIGDCLIEEDTFFDAVYWREKELIRALRILCLAAVREESFQKAVNDAQGTLTIVPLINFRRRGTAPSMPKAVDVHLSSLVDLLVSSRVGERFFPSVVGYIGYNSSNSTNDGEMAGCSLALALFAYHQLERSRSMRVLCGDTQQHGSKYFAEAVAQRLYISSQRRNSLPDSRLSEALLDWILMDLRQRISSSSWLSQTLLGLPTATTSGTWIPGSKTAFLRPKDCFDTILALLRDVNFVLGDETSGYASSCFETLFRLCSLSMADDLSVLRRVLYSAERLRAADVDFWYKNLLLFVAGDSAVLTKLSANNHEGSAGDVNMVHSLSWLLMGVAGELRLLMGVSDGSGPEAQFGSLVAPRPPEFQRLRSILFTSPHNLVVQILCHLPIDRRTIEPVSPPSKDAVAAATFDLKGAHEVVTGYTLVDSDTLVEAMKSQDQFVNADALRRWAFQWNHSIEWACATSHLSSAIHSVVGVFLLNCRTIGYGISEGLAHEGLASVADLFALMLKELLQRLLRNSGDVGKNRPGMDDFFFTSATRTLSLVVLMLSEELGLTWQKLKVEQQALGTSEILTICAALARAVSFSWFSNDHIASSDRRYERSAVFGSALLLLLRTVPDDDIAELNRLELSRAAVALAHLSSECAGGLTHNNRFTVRSAAITVGRSCFAALCDIEPSLVMESLGLNGDVSYPVKSNRMKDFLELVSSLDDSVAQVLGKIANLPRGDEFLVDSGIVEAMLHAVQKYHDEEARVKMLCEKAGTTFQRSNMDTPSFLSGHLRILTTLLRSRSLSTVQEDRLIQGILAFFRGFDPLVQCLLDRFPRDGIVLHDLVQCVYQLSTLCKRRTLRNHGAYGIASPSSPDISALGSRHGSQICRLCLDIAENPLPPRVLLSPIPQGLTKDERQAFSAVISLSDNEERSWWDRLVQIDGQEVDLDDANGHTEHFEFCVVAASILECGLSFLRQEGLSNFLDGRKLAIGIIRCTDASRLVLRQSMMVNRNALPYGAVVVIEQTETDDGEPSSWRRLALQLSRIVEQLLLLALTCIGELKDGGLSSKPATVLFSRAILESLERTGIENSGISRVGSEAGDEPMGISLARKLRSELILE